MNPITDVRGLSDLKLRAAADPKAAVREAAKQFEAIFMQEILKHMREASKFDGSMDNEGSELGRELLDAQWAQQLTGLPGGLSDAIARQLERQMVGTVTAAPSPAASAAAGTTASTPAAAPAPLGAAVRAIAPPQRAAAAFVAEHTQAARAAEAASGIPASFMLAQAAHETGWGKHQIRHADGSSAHNYFGIKAGPSWKGATADVLTTEYIAGQPRKVVQKFRAYASAAESFADYARLMTHSPRYAPVVAAGNDAHGFAQGLQRAGYATDPAYAAKLGRVINTTLSLQRSLGS